MPTSLSKLLWQKQLWVKLLKRAAVQFRKSDRVRRTNAALMATALVVPIKSPKKATSRTNNSCIAKTAEQTGVKLWYLQGEIIHVCYLILKLLKFVLLFLPVVFSIPLLYMGENWQNIWYKFTVATVERCGATAIKLGQWASARPDLFSPEFCNALSKLQRHVTPHNFEFTKYKLRMKFGKNWRRIIVGLEKNPIGSGCVAQVYRAQLRLDGISDGEIVEELRSEFIENEDDVNWFEGLEVIGFRKDTSEEFVSDIDSNSADDNLIPIAIKVLHPGVRQSVLSDLSVLHAVAVMGEALIPAMRYCNLIECVNEFSHLMKQQIDLRHEADNMEIFTKNFETDNDIRFSRPLRPFVWRDIIVESYEEGIPISHFLPGHISRETYMESGHEETTLQERTEDPLVRERLATMGLKALLDMIFTHNFVHADLHPGNLAVQIAGPIDKNEKVELVHLFDTVMVQVTPRENPLTLVMYDCGIVTKLAPDKHESITEVFKAIVTNDGEKVGQLFADHSILSKTTNRERFVQDMAQLINEATRDTLVLRNIQVGALIGNFFQLLSSHKVKLDSNFVNIMLAVMVLEGLGRTLDPNIDLLDIMKTHLFH